MLTSLSRFPYGDDNPQVLGQNIYTLLWEDEHGAYPIGYVLDRVIQELVRVPTAIAGDIEVDHEQRTLKMLRLPTEQQRTERLGQIASYFRDNNTFKLLKGWRAELWPVFGRNGELLFSMERAAMGLIGTMRYGVHMTAYVRDPAAPHGIKVWVPVRAADKSTFPGMLDNTVAGGLMTGEDEFECMVREADEEASLPEEVVRTRAERVGTVTYLFITDDKNCGEAGFVYPECEWVYDLLLPADVIPQPKDGEVAEFRLCDVEQIKSDLKAGNFKTNCAVVMLDFFIRHGILTAENEPDFELVKQRMHRDIPFPGPHRDEWRAA